MTIAQLTHHPEGFSLFIDKPQMLDLQIVGERIDRRAHDAHRYAKAAGAKYSNRFYQTVQSFAYRSDTDEGDP